MSNKVYEIITERIVGMLEKGVIPWRQPWVNGDAPKNLISKREYRGINVFLLSCQGFTSPYWLTFKQAKALGGSIKKGAKGTMVIFWKPIESTETDKDTGETTTKQIPLLRYYRVFNVEQCDGINKKKIPQIDLNEDFQPILSCEETVNAMQNAPEIKFEEPRAYYHPKDDFVNMPKKETFEKEESYYSVLFHELGHATGHKTRLNRQGQGGNFGSKDYSKEELVAEMTAAYLCGIHGIENETVENSAAYIKEWLSMLKSDVKLVVLAAAQAQKASDYILNRI